jgi:hypothetical protein
LNKPVCEDWFGWSNWSSNLSLNELSIVVTRNTWVISLLLSRKYVIALI